MENVINETVVKFASQIEDVVATLTGDQDARELQDKLTEFYPFLANATYTESIVDTVKTVVFAEKMGTKGKSL